MELFWWVASQLSCESGWPCRGTTASCGDSSSASSTSTASSAAATTAATAAATATEWDGLDRKACDCGCRCGGLCLCAGHGVRCENLWGGCNVLSLVGGIFRVGQFSFG